MSDEGVAPIDHAEQLRSWARGFEDGPDPLMRAVGANASVNWDLRNAANEIDRLRFVLGEKPPPLGRFDIRIVRRSTGLSITVAHADGSVGGPYEVAPIDTMSIGLAEAPEYQLLLRHRAVGEAATRVIHKATKVRLAKGRRARRAAVRALIDASEALARA